MGTNRLRQQLMPQRETDGKSRRAQQTPGPNGHFGENVAGSRQLANGFKKGDEDGKTDSWLQVGESHPDISSPERSPVARVEVGQLGNRFR